MHLDDSDSASDQCLTADEIYLTNLICSCDLQ